MVSFNNLQGGTKRVYSVRGGDSNGTSDYNQLINKPAINGTILTSTTSTTDLGISGDYGDLTNKPAIEGVELTPTTTLTDLGIDNRTDTMLVDFSFDQNLALMPITNATSLQTTQSITYTLPENMKQDWKICGPCKWEMWGADGKRADAILVQAFTMDGQAAIRMHFKTTGNTPKSINRATIGIILTKR